MRLARQTGSVLSDLVLPRLCVACKAPVLAHGRLCPLCWGGCTFIGPQICDRLGFPLAAAEPGQISYRALAEPPMFSRARAATLYDGTPRRLIRALKFHDQLNLADLLSRWLASAAASLAKRADVLVPVPISRMRLLSRKFNQSAVLAQRTGKVIDRPVDVAGLRRIRRTLSQVGLDAEARLANVQDAFAVSRGHHFAGMRVLLIDDIITTGATANACATALLEAGAANVDVAAVCLVDRDRMAWQLEDRSEGEAEL